MDSQILNTQFKHFDFQIVHQIDNHRGKFPVGNLGEFLASEFWAGYKFPGMSGDFHKIISNLIIRSMSSNELVSHTDERYGMITADPEPGYIANHERWVYPLTKAMFVKQIKAAHDTYLYMNSFLRKKPDNLIPEDVYLRSYFTIKIVVEKFNLTIMLMLKPLVLSLPNKESVLCSALKWHAGSITIMHGALQWFQHIRWTTGLERRFGKLALGRCPPPRTTPVYTRPPVKRDTRINQADFPALGK